MATRVVGVGAAVVTARVVGVTEGRSLLAVLGNMSVLESAPESVSVGENEVASSVEVRKVAEGESVGTPAALEVSVVREVVPETGPLGVAEGASES